MRLNITHRAEYGYDQPLVYALQRLRLFPASGALQTVRAWSLTIGGAREEVRFTDHFGNDTRLVSVGGGPHAIVIEAAGEVETFNRAGVAGPHRGFAPLWLFLRNTPLTATNDGIKALAARTTKGRELGSLHELMAAIHADAAPAGEMKQMQTSGSAVETTEAGPTPQDHTHAFIAAARLVGFPARYVGGYLMADGVVGQAASHGWAEAHVDGLGWVGFDVANGISPDENYVRIALGRDYRDTLPVSGIRPGRASEQLAVRIIVEQ